MVRIRLSAALPLVLLSAVMLLGACSGESTRTLYCDGIFPQWVLDAQDYDNGGCAEAIPFDQAPENADWTPVCTGMCLCPQGELYIDTACTAIAADRPWPSSIPYP